MSRKTEEQLDALIAGQGPLGLARLARYHSSAIATAAVAGLVVRPTTVAAITLWNGENKGGRSMVMDRAFSHMLVSSAAEGYGGMWYCNHKEMDEPANDILTLRGSGDGRVATGGPVVVDIGATVLDDGWFPIGGNAQAEAAGVLPSGNLEGDFGGKIVVPPGHGISLHVVTSVVAETYTTGASWWLLDL